jgi:hypothetical protein
MKMRQKVAIYIDYCLRVPNFTAAYKSFKDELFSDKSSDFDTEDELQKEDVRFYWSEQMKNSEVEQFYFKSKLPEDDYAVRETGINSFFYNDDHMRRFLDEYSYNLFLDCVVPNRQDIDIINVAQQSLFDVVLVDEYESRRKVGNTYYFLAKNPVYPQSLLFLAAGQQINEANYIGIWNPKKDTTQVNAPGNKDFLNWFLELEKKSKENVGI